MPPSKFEANSTLHRGVKRASFSLFTLASSCANTYYRVYAIIDFLADQLVFLNTVTKVWEGGKNFLHLAVSLALQYSNYPQPVIPPRSFFV